MLFSGDNKIYLNDFIDNAGDLYSLYSNTIWNTTEELEYAYKGSTCKNYMGNYWGDYEDKYPNATEQIDGCGIWDTNYSIEVDNNDSYPLMDHSGKYTAAAGFDTGPGENPAICGMHKGTITPTRNITEVQKLYTYPCAGTGGHTEYVRIEEGARTLAEEYWDGYQSGDYHNITFSQQFTMFRGRTYNYTIITGSYPQIIHKSSFNATGGVITCTEFVDANGKRYNNNWIPAIRLGKG
jgi:hypothetical protein